MCQAQALRRRLISATARFKEVLINRQFVKNKLKPIQSFLNQASIRQKRLSCKRETCKQS